MDLPYSSFKLKSYRWKRWDAAKRCDVYSHHALVFSDPGPGVVPFYNRRSAQAPQNYWCEGEKGCGMSVKVPLNPMQAVGASFEPFFLHPKKSHGENCVAIATRKLEGMARWNRCEELARAVAVRQFLEGKDDVFWSQELLAAENWEGLKDPSYGTVECHLGKLVKQVREGEEAWFDEIFPLAP